jgi:hypothetical protein
LKLYLKRAPAMERSTLISESPAENTSTVERPLSELISDKYGSDDRKLNSYPPKNTSIIIKTKTLLKQVKHEKLIHVIIN